MKLIINQKLRSFGCGFLGIIIFIGLLLLPVIIIMGTVWIAAIFFPFLIIITSILSFLSLFVFLPMTFFPKTKTKGALALIYSSFLFGITLWIYAALVAYLLWGILGLLVGLFILGVGVVPISFLAILISGEWLYLMGLIYLIFITFVSRSLGFNVLEPKNRNYNKLHCCNCNNEIHENEKFCQKCGVGIIK